MWTKLETNEDIQEAIDVMKQMDRNYAGLTVATARSYETSRNMYGYLYRAGNDRIVLALEPFANGNRVRVYTAGFSGSLSPQQAATLSVQQLRVVMREQGANAFVASVRNVDHEPLNQAIDAMRADPRLRVRVRADNGKFTLIEATEAGCSDKSCIFEWTGTQWAKISDDCKNGCVCYEPTVPGTFLGQKEVILCQSAPS